MSGGTSGVATWKYEGLEACCRCDDMEVWRSGGVLRA